MKKLVTLFVSAIISMSAFAQWDTLHTNTTTNFNAISFSSETNGVAVGNDPITGNGNVFYTSDAGASWAEVENGTHGKNDVCFSSQTKGWIACDSGYIEKTGTSGSVWSYGAQIGTKDFYTLFFVNDTIGYVGGEDGVLYRTTDSGVTWDTLSSGTNLSINDLYFADAANGWIVGDGGYMAATADSGTTWTTVANPNFGFFQCNGFAYVGSTAEAYAVGNSGNLIQSSDGGLNWSALSSNTTFNLNSVRFTNNLAGIVVGDSGIVHRTQDGGLTWLDESMSYVKNKLTGISWASDTLAYICGSNGRILKSHSDISSVHELLPAGFELSAFPNPFADALNLVIDLRKNSNVRIVVMDVAGRIVLEENEGELSSGKQMLRPAGISLLGSGMYFVTVMTDDSRMTIPVVKR